MKKYYCITILALLVVTLLQGYNVSLQYKEYIYKEIDKINSALKVSVDEEYAIRAHQNYNPHKDGKQRLYTKIMTDEDFLKAKPKKEDVIRFDEINIQDLRDKGIAETEAEAMGLLTKDRLTAKGNPINLKKLSQIFKKNLNEDFSYTLLILDENKKVIKSYGQTKDIETWQASKPIGIGLKPIRFVQAKVDITPSSFIINSIETLISTILLALIIVFCVGYQMTAIRNKEDLLRNREVSLHGTVHDLKAPLASILLKLGFIKDCIKDADLKEMITSSERQIKNLANTIKTILITSKAGESKLVINKEQVDIIELTQQAQEQIDTNYASKPHTIGIHDHREEKALVYTDKYLIENVMHNLMENAVKYSDKEANVDVSIKQDEHFTIISVSDHGVGIDKKYQKKIFEQFYRIPATHHKSGYGIGLAMVKYAVKAHGGTIKVVSELGKGSTFTFTLPLN
ncbi:sensor histidine kinase [Prevotella sp. AM34-19LB]|jgi:signal transduction histidine kinase|nr:sensor histidine kinase [Prevotella sp. AM34-19LB]